MKVLHVNSNEDRTIELLLQNFNNDFFEEIWNESFKSNQSVIREIKDPDYEDEVFQFDFKAYEVNEDAKDLIETLQGNLLDSESYFGIIIIE